MDSKEPLYQLTYLFTVPTLRNKVQYLQQLMAGLRTREEAPEGNQPTLVDDSTVAFSESLEVSDLKSVDGHLKAVFASVFEDFLAYSKAHVECATLGLTIFFVSPKGKKFAMYCQTTTLIQADLGYAHDLQVGDIVRQQAVFGYAYDLQVGDIVRPEDIMHTTSGKDMVYAMLAYFGLLDLPEQSVN